MTRSSQHYLQQQHSVLNHFLNETLKLSHQPDINRKPLTYVHRKHRDVFYDLPRSQLPALLDIHTQRHHPKVRVTYDEKTGAVVARIIKCRVADLDVYSPRTQLDWRLSVNIEMEYTGSLNDLNLSKENAGMDNGDGQGYRIKDRVSYLHNNAYQIDLTQVQVRHFFFGTFVDAPHLLIKLPPSSSSLSYSTFHLTIIHNRTREKMRHHQSQILNTN